MKKEELDFTIHEILIPPPKHYKQFCRVVYKVWENGAEKPEWLGSFEFPPEDLKGLTLDQQTDLIATRIRTHLDARVDQHGETSDLAKMTGLKFGLIKKGTDPKIEKDKKNDPSVP